MSESVALILVTGANRGLGQQFTRQLLDRGAAKVYATARNPETITTPGVEVLKLDLLDLNSIEQAAAAAGDVTLLINNAGVSSYQNLIRGDITEVRREMETHFFGTLAVTRAFADTLGRDGAARSSTSFPRCHGSHGRASPRTPRRRRPNGA